MMRRAGRSRCPGDEKLLAAFLLELDPPKRERIAEHVAGCPMCGRKLTLLAGISEDLRERAEGLPAGLAPEEEAALRKMARAEIRELKRRSSSRPAPGPAAFRATAVAMALIAAAAAGIFFYQRIGRRDVDRGDRNGIRLIEPAGTLDRAPTVFRWTPVRNADIYRFEIFDEELRSIVVRDIKSTSVALSAEEQAALRPGKPYYWDVEASDDDSRPVASGQRSFIFPAGGATKPPSAPIRTNPAHRRGCP